MSYLEGADTGVHGACFVGPRLLERFVMRHLVSLLLLLSTLAFASGCANDLDARDGEDLAADALRRCGTRGTTLPGIDVSHHNGRIDWDAVDRAGIRFAFVRVSDAMYQDTEFDRNWGEARRVGIVRGVYQYFRPNRDPIAQADLMLRRMGALEDDDLAPVIDVEDDGGLSPATVAARVNQWVDYVRAATGRTPIVYTAYYFWRDEVGDADPRGAPLWIANYGVSCPLVPDAWARWTFFQHTETGRVPGIVGNVDRNWFDGDEADLLALTATDMGPAPSATAVDWWRESDGVYQLRAYPPDGVARVEYFVEGYRIGSASRSAGPGFPARYPRFNVERTGRLFEVRGYDDAGTQVAHGVGSIDSVPGSAVFIRQLGAGLYEIGLERAVSAVAAIEVRADGITLTDSVSGLRRSPRRAVRSSFTRLGLRNFEIRTYDSRGGLRGTLRRSLTLE